MQTVPGLWARDIAELLATQGDRRQPLPGFDADYADIVDYIIRCTHRIWEGKDVGLIHTHYAEDCPVWTMGGPVVGREAVTRGTFGTLAAFPDRTLVGEAVIWSDEGGGAYHSSHRILSHATHLGANDFGPPTGRRLRFRTIADCMVRANRIEEEWLVRDTAAMAIGVGLTPRAAAERAGALSEVAREWIERERARVSEVEQPAWSDEPLPPAEADPHAFARALFARLWGDRRLAAVREAYAPNVRWEGPGARTLFGWGEVTGWYAAMHAALPGAHVSLDHLAAVREGPHVEIALRWTLAAEHGGGALYGAPTGRRVLILGVTHWRVTGGRIAREWTVYDEVALWRQLL